jgi:hypothetical protein
MKNIILLISIITSSFVFAQNDKPAELDSQDLIGEINKPEFEDADLNIDLDEFIPKMQMPVLAPQIEPVEKEAPKPNTASIAKVEDPKETQEATKEPKKKVAPKIENATTVLSMQQLKSNDLIRIEFSQIKVYRRVKGKIIKYKFRNGLDLNSSGLNKKDETTYYVKDTSILIRDTKKAKQEKQELAKQNKQDEKKNIQAKVIESNSESEDTELLLKLRTDIENQLNNGKKIKNELLIKNLRTNDMIYIIGDVLLVTRKNKATSGTKKFWLLEAIDIENSSLEKEANNRYKVIRKYK